MKPIEEKLKKVLLHHSARTIASLFPQASKDNLSHENFLHRLLDDELASRHDNRIKRLVQEARFPSLKTLDSFDWSHPASIPKALVIKMTQLDFVREKQHLILVGPGGVGKSHLATALGFIACQQEFRTLFTTAADMINTLVASQADHSLGKALKRFTSPKLLIIDELGYLPLDKQGRDLFFQVISKRAEVGSMILTTNKAFKDWGEVFLDNAVASAIAERLIEHGELIRIEGGSYRVKKRRQKLLGLDSLETKPDQDS
jgi:DNA replication protein DnaC